MPRSSTTRSYATTSSSSLTIPCPIPTCSLNLYKNKPALIQYHLRHSHTSTETISIPPQFYQDAGVMQCTLCPPNKPTLFSSQNRLQSHMRSVHKATTRTAPNSDIILTHFPPLPSVNANVSENWKSSLRYMQRLDAAPFSFRKSIYHRLDYKTKKELNSIAYKLYFALSHALAPHEDAHDTTIPSYETSSSPLWKMALLFEGTILSPPTSTEPRNYQKLIRKRIATFREGRFSALHRNAISIVAPPSYASPSTETRKEHITRAANNDNWRKASQLLKDPLPAMPYTSANLPKVINLHPPPTSFNSTANIPKPTQRFHIDLFSKSDSKFRNRIFDKHLLLKTLRKLTRDTAAGPYADSTDFLRDVFLTRSQSITESTDDYSNIPALSTLLEAIFQGTIPKDIQSYLSYAESVSFYKDPPTCEAIRPIGIGVAWRRIATAHAMAISRDAIAAHLAPHQFAIGIHGGLDFVAHTMQTQVERYLTLPPTTSNPPTRAILLLDLINMFNTISMVKARDLIYTHFPHLLPLFDILYYQPTRCWYRDPDGQRRFFLRQEGSSQGCPFAAFLACLVLHEVLSPISKELTKRAANRKSNGDAGDDGLGSNAILMSYIDDCTLSLHYDDLLYFIEAFNTIGHPLGCKLKQQKCKVLTSTTNISPLPYLPLNHASSLTKVLEQYCGGVTKGEALNGVRILGAPIGNSTFVEQYQNKTIQKLTSTVSTLQNLVSDPHIATALFKFSLQHYTSHLLLTDMLHNKSTSTSTSLHTSEFTNTINTIAQNFIAQIAVHHSAQTTLPAHSWYVASTPSGLGGLGFDDAAAKSIPHFIKPLANTIRAALHGITPQIVDSPNLQEPPTPVILLPKHIVYSFRSWRSSTLNIFQTYRDIVSQYVSASDSPQMLESTDKLLTYTLHCALYPTTRKLYRHYTISRLRDLWPTLPKDIQLHFPSMMSSLTSTPMGAVTRTDNSNHFKPDEFRIYLQRKLRLPLWPTHYKCLCGSTIDKYGDHYLTCRSVSKIDLHNRMRDAVYSITSQICPIISDVTSRDIHLETPHLIDQAPLMRPGDVVIKHPISTAADPHSLSMVDITIIPPPTVNTTPASFEEAMKMSNAHHTKYEYNKFRLKDNKHSHVTADHIAQEMTQKRYRLLPFTIDHLGRIGPLAEEFLYDHKPHDDPIVHTNYVNRQTSTHISLLIQMSLRKSRQKNILNHATKNWKMLFGDKWYTNTYHAQTPGQWAKQVIGNTFSIHSAKHILRAMTNAANQKFQTTSKTNNISCCSTNLHTPTTYTLRSLQYALHSP